MENNQRYTRIAQKLSQTFLQWDTYHTTFNQYFYCYCIIKLRLGMLYNSKTTIFIPQLLHRTIGPYHSPTLPQLLAQAHISTSTQSVLQNDSVTPRS